MAHIGVGVVSALALLQPTTPEGCVAAVIGAAVGSLICDVDIRSSERQQDAFRGRMVVLLLVSALFAYDYLQGGMLCSTVVERLGAQTVLRVTVFVATCVVGALTPHRTFAHSLVATGLWCWSISLVYPPLVQPFGIGVASHLLLDLTNHQGLQLFWPLGSKMSLGLWRSSGLVNTLLSVVAPIAAVLLFSWCMMLIGL